MDVGGGSEQIVLENGVIFLPESAEGEGNWAIAQFDVARLAHDAIGIWDGEVGEAAVVLFEPVGTL